MKIDNVDFLNFLNNPKFFEEFLDTTIYAMKNCIPLKEFCEADEELYENLYGLATCMYENEEYKRALPLFATLSFLNAQDPRFILGMAACNQCLKHYDLAIICYMSSFILDVTDPRPPFYAAECYIATKEIKEAIYACEAAMNVDCHGKEKEEIRSKAKKMYELLVQNNN